ncbi:hypothetical protein PCASD_09113, partial [Puccinia coronata f. sp. avenae]
AISEYDQRLLEDESVRTGWLRRPSLSTCNVPSNFVHMTAAGIQSVQETQASLHQGRTLLRLQ